MTSSFSPNIFPVAADSLASEFSVAGTFFGWKCFTASSAPRRRTSVSFVASLTGARVGVSPDGGERDRDGVGRILVICLRFFVGVSKAAVLLESSSWSLSPRKTGCWTSRGVENQSSSVRSGGAGTATENGQVSSSMAARKDKEAYTSLPRRRLCWSWSLA